MESEADYCKRRFEEYNVAKMVERATPPGARTLALMTVANAYLDREVAVTWQSAESGPPARYPAAGVLVHHDSDLRLEGDLARAGAAHAALPHAGRVRRASGTSTKSASSPASDPVFNSPQWTLAGWPNRWEAPLAFDSNLATRWRTWEPVRAGMYLDIELGNPQRLTSAVLVTHTPVFRVPLEVYGLDVKGAWQLLTSISGGDSARPAGSTAGSGACAACGGLPLPAGAHRDGRQCRHRQCAGGARGGVGAGACRRGRTVLPLSREIVRVLALQRAERHTAAYARSREALPQT